MTVGLSAVNMAARILNIYRNTAISAITTVYAELHTADPGAAGATSVSLGSTTRNAVVFAAPSAGSMTLTSVSAWTNGGTSETLSHIALWDAATVGNFLQSFALSSTQAWVSTNTFTLTTFTITYTPIAA
jgi:hypothetical protein